MRGHYDDDETAIYYGYRTRRMENGGSFKSEVQSGIAGNRSGGIGSVCKDLFQ
jgi:hypothetical protein